MKTIFKKIIAYILRIESRLVILRYKPKIVAITGSVGKTSTKDAVYAVISGVSYVRKSEKSYNSEIGLPLTILGIPLAIWGTNVTTTIAILSARIDRQEKDLGQQQQIQTLATGQIIDVNKQLAKIDTLLGEFRNDLKPRR